MNNFLVKVTIVSVCFLSLFFSQTTHAQVPSSPNLTCVNLSVNLGVSTNSVSTLNEVILLQNFLREQGYLASVSTGHFGRLTQDAVKKFQLAYLIEPTGFVGPMTRTKIRALTCSLQNSLSSASSSKLQVFPTSATRWMRGSTQSLVWTEQNIGSNSIDIYLKNILTKDMCFIASVPANQKKYDLKFDTLTFAKTGSCGISIDANGTYSFLLTYYKGTTSIESETAHITVEENDKRQELEVTSPTSGLYNVKSAVTVILKHHVPEQKYALKLEGEVGPPVLWKVITTKKTDIHREVLEVPGYVPDGRYTVLVEQLTYRNEKGKNVACPPLTGCESAHSPGKITIYHLPGMIPVRIVFSHISQKNGEISFKYSLVGAIGDLPVKRWEIQTSCPEGITSEDLGEKSFRCNKKFDIEALENDDGEIINDGNVLLLPGKLMNIHKNDIPAYIQATAWFENEIEDELEDEIEPKRVIGGDGETITVPGVRAITITSPNGGETYRNERGSAITTIKWDTVASFAGRKVTIRLVRGNGSIAKVLASDVSNVGQFTLLPSPEIVSGKYRVSVSVLDKKGSAEDYSDGVFTIQSMW